MGGDCDAMILAAAQTRKSLANSGFCCLFLMFVCVNAFYLLQKSGANRHVCITNRVLPAVLISKIPGTFDLIRFDF